MAAAKPGGQCGELASDRLAGAPGIQRIATGLPAISLPAGFSKGLPVGLQLIGPGFEESRLLAAGHAQQSATEWHRATPPGHWYG